MNYGILGNGLAQQIGTLDFDKLQICAPRGGERINLANPIESFSIGDLHAGGLSFAVGQRKYDDTYILTSLDFARTLFEKEGRLSRLELRLRPGSNIERVKDELRRTVGAKYQVLDRMEQQADVFNVMKFEKFFAYLFLTFIVLLACFNVVSSLSMVILEKRDDVRTLRHSACPYRACVPFLSPRAVSSPSSARSPASPSASHSSCSNKNLASSAWATAAISSPPPIL